LASKASHAGIIQIGFEGISQPHIVEHPCFNNSIETFPARFCKCNSAAIEVVPFSNWSFARKDYCCHAIPTDKPNEQEGNRVDTRRIPSPSAHSDRQKTQESQADLRGATLDSCYNKAAADYLSWGAWRTETIVPSPFAIT
jgi:hypothetical protein